ncbi:hypothetical protein CEUSTIGMA_g4082.t1 [Chlamydomonas eustigma]|uniref:Uracil-DNA glycosylase n=1 Tax=Chlamydomonas eustigma TaxID=1157962 RepID=A0A250X0Q6_9CHLO|nr:hypothetical protein CEUSTIGMA_g4082.t1 [Chlamydomonas eustigma]|eukprot:GAX76636.1 hypothetical protein CEUSTIGMA_g4082.t1 [Chlamydomonas eustigma]
MQLGSHYRYRSLVSSWPRSRLFSNSYPSNSIAMSENDHCKTKKRSRQSLLSWSKQKPQDQQPKATGFQLSALLTDDEWKDSLQQEFQKDYFMSLQEFLVDEFLAQEIYPSKEHIFRAFNTTPLHQVKAVIIGQDPYHQPGQAMGLSFSVPQGIKVPSSLGNIYKEIKSDIPGYIVPKHGDLEGWAKQGVLLLNAVLTVRHDKAASHSKQGWEEFTNEAIRQLSQKRTGIVFLLWGKYAQEKVKLIDCSKHHVLQAAHPSGLSAHRGFFGCKHFSKANEILLSEGKEIIRW